MINSYRVFQCEFIVVPLLLYYGRLFTVGLSTTWGIVVATCVNKTVDTFIVVCRNSIW